MVDLEDVKASAPIYSSLTLHIIIEGALLVRRAAILQGMTIQSNEPPLPALSFQAVGPLETAILGVLWACPQPLTVRAIHAALRDRALAYTTIITTMARMTEQGMVSRAPTAARHAVAYCSTAPIERLRSTMAA